MENINIKTDGKMVLIGTLVAVIIIMSIGYAALSQRLQITGTASITSSWDVKITDIQQSGKTGTATETSEPSKTSTTATFDVTLNAPGDSMTYDITVSNNGDLDAILKQITVTPESSSEGIIYTVSGVESNTTKLASGETNTVTVKVEWKQVGETMPEELSKTVTVVLDYEQDMN